MVQSDAQRIAEIYRRSGRYDVHVTPEIIEQPNNRVDLVFTITEGQKTGVKSIDFVGNTTYSSYRLKDVIKTRESNLLSFLGGNDVYDPDRVEADRDLIRRFYLKNGFADVQVVAALTEYDPERKGFLVTFKIEPRLCLRRGASARRPQFRCPYRVGGVRRRRRSAGLHRAHQHPRQYPDPGFRGPSRVRYLGRRRV
jgi:hypothetical protein